MAVSPFPILFSSSTVSISDLEYSGAHAVNVHATNTRNTDPEVIEKRTAVIVKQYAIRINSGGRGLYNGGNGTIREIETRQRLRFSILSERRVFAPYGMEGGEDGMKGENLVWKRSAEGSMEKISLGGKAVILLDEGEIIRICTPGGKSKFFTDKSAPKSPKLSRMRVW